MRTTLIIRDEVLPKASALTGVKEKTALVHIRLEIVLHIE
ncbi:MAG: type II toxin-antitoxin system VapB family antitoxin [Kiritimatiellae bacterium]|nr:type II toxin-antitoxin system VapB family antitoxin [Kiritimatiellia bacterium]MBW7908661.1 type II toxin-antitoxin system VapB family antitoxin [Kiritimatiellia bacterium]MCO5044425.1 type II toxin-antitoxin system VapB family antitoxin [Kiritimatiellia bacterium]